MNRVQSNWHKTDYGSTILDVVMKKSGMSKEELISPKTTDPASIENLENAADVVADAVRRHTPISVMADYDADGITSAAILSRMLKKLGAEPQIRLPKRLSEGYGLSVDAINDFDPGLLITVDNGITAINEIAYAKQCGFSVVILDHHLPKEELPDADVIVDPHVHPSQNGFEHYCGAGLALKLAEMMLAKGASSLSDIMEQLAILATIGTIGDVMPLIGDNRRIVKEGLALLRHGKWDGLWGLKLLFDEAGAYNRNETDIGFKIAPALNAPGRMEDDGADRALELLLMDPDNGQDEHSIQKFAQELVLINDERKKAVTLAMEQADQVITDNCALGDCPLCVCLNDIPEGIVGIVAGRLAEAHKVPAFVFTASSEPDVLKGSGRSYGGVNIMDIVEAALPFLCRSGGHESAAGISVLADNYRDMVTAMKTYMQSIDVDDSDTVEYDLEITTKDVLNACKTLSLYAPYGEGNPAPVFCVSDATLVSRYGSRFKPMGKDGTHLKLFCNGFSAIAFGGTKRYIELGKPVKIDMVGTISENKFQYASECQVEITDFRLAQKDAQSTALLEALKRNGTI